MKHLTRIEQINIQLEILREYRQQLDFLIFTRENEKKELEEKEKVKKGIYECIKFI